MNLFADYIQPLTHWLQSNPNAALLLTFFMALAESLAIIGSIIPGSVTMTALGILAGSGIMRLDLTLAAATLGAVCGDSLSYALGFYYSEHLLEIWPFKKYPKWIGYAKDFFVRHGGKSVLIGRFIGPMRSFIPVIAGILHMQQGRFLLANVFSAIGWSVLYVMPGALIGAASHGLSQESATRLFLFVLLFLAGLWLSSLLIKGLYIKLSYFLKNTLHIFWLQCRSNPKLAFLYKAFTPAGEVQHSPTATLLMLTLLCFLSLAVLTLSSKTLGLDFINVPVYLLMQSMSTDLIKAFFIVCTQAISIATLMVLYSLCSLCFVYQKQFKSFFYLSSVLFSSLFIALLTAYLIPDTNPPELRISMPASSFPNLEIATAFYGFILFYLNKQVKTKTLGLYALKTFVFIVLGLGGLGSIYLGDLWVMDGLIAYLAGAGLCMLHYLLYRKYAFSDQKKALSPVIFSTLFFFGMLGCTAFFTYTNFKTSFYQHSPHQKKYTLQEAWWWDQKVPLLPVYRLNRIGNKISLLNIQYLGDLDLLQNALEGKGWTLHKESFFTKLLMRLNAHPYEAKFPLLAQLYENKQPELIMTYKDLSSQWIVELNIWESNYRTAELNQPLWIGTLHFNTRSPGDPLSYFLPALSAFTVKSIQLPKTSISATLFPVPPVIILIKEPSESMR